MGYELIITEKPSAANKIATALDDGKPVKENLNGVPYYKVTHGNQDIVVACAVGHLYGLEEKEKKGWVFPVFDIEWKPNDTKKNNFSKKYLSAIKKLAKDATEFTVATDFDVEGEVIGLNVITLACKQKDANRMKFSTLTKPDLVKAYEEKRKTLEWGQANAGETRHFLDWYTGINYSRALTAAYKSTGGFKILSIGRVQGPALKVIVDREKEIKAFKPVPYWQIELNAETLEAWHQEDKFWEKNKAEEVMKKVKGEKEGTIIKTEKKSFQQQPPFPFDLTSLQVEAYKVFKIQPKETLSHAQELYTAGHISYPRTSSQQLPKAIGYEKILKALANQDVYAEHCKNLLKTKLEPNNGKKTDPAHPAIYPTGTVPEAAERTLKIYDLIARRFMATFAEPATRETAKIHIDVKKEIFIAKGTRTVEPGWFTYYGKYVMLQEEELPEVKEKDIIKIKKITNHSKETQPPKRYTPASIIKDLEKKNLGTKATRASIVDTLFLRHYVHGTKSIEATELGIRTVNTLEKFCPKILDEEMTRHFEVEMEQIRENKKKKEDVLNEAKGAITKIVDDFKKNEKAIGEELKSAHIETRDALTTLGQCPKCKKGDLQIRKGKYGAFVACNQYPDCKTTFSLPSNAKLTPSKKACEVCSFPMITAQKRGKRPMDFCLNPDCKSKDIEEVEEKPCPTCKEGKIILRKSLYGAFYGCDQYPKCKYTEQIEKQSEESDGTKEK